MLHRRVCGFTNNQAWATKLIFTDQTYLNVTGAEAEAGPMKVGS